MACSRPLRAFQLPDGTVKVIGSNGARLPQGSRALELPCGQCIRCKLSRAREAAIRCVHEASLYDHNCFLTLTYDDQHLPRDLSLNHRHFQLFMKRLRRRFFSSTESGVRYYMCGEYGEARGRPHYHCILFNFHFKDQLFYSSRGGHNIYTSRTLDDLWQLGNCMIGAVTFESASYVARYCVDKITGPDAEKHYNLLDKTTGEYFHRKPEYTKSSNRPGIGAPWLHKFLRDVYPRGDVLSRNHFTKAPRYYDKIFRRDYDHDDKQYNIIKDKRLDHAKLQAPDNTRARRDVKEELARLKLNDKRKPLK